MIGTILLIAIVWIAGACAISDLHLETDKVNLFDLDFKNIIIWLLLWPIGIFYDPTRWFK